ncbi:hypothetical protein QYF36_020955 [Acer negundo]|nr:hypothetical protein QYF36_020955 [Acer negundo]
METRQFPHQTLVFKSAVISRLLLLTLIVLWRTLLNPYDTSASLNPDDCLIDDSRWRHRHHHHRSSNNSIGSKIESSIVWDSVFFVRIVQCGYEYEQTYAFLPLLPACISFLSRTVFAPFVAVIGYRAVLGLCGYVVSNVAFLFAAVYFYRLAVVILKDPEAAFRASILFCFNPASIFYSSIYSESLYALFSVGGLYYLILCIGLMMLFSGKNELAILVLIDGALRCICIFIPFIAFQVYGYRNLCLGRSPDEMRPWCKARVPLLYNFIQSHYWQVGFLRYFQFKQLPNFLLASPILSLALCSIIHYAKSQPKLFFSLGFQESNEGQDFTPVLSSSGIDPKSSSKKKGNENLRQRKPIYKGGNPVELSVENGSPVNSGYLSTSVLPFILHLGFMTATAFFVMHVQVSTRFLSASPPLYWFASYLMISPGTGKRWGYLIWAYCAAYILLGSLLFSNFYPFT